MATFKNIVFFFLIAGVCCQNEELTTEPNTPPTVPTTTPTTTTTPNTTPPTTTPRSTSTEPAPTPEPTPDEYFRVVEKNLTCVMFGGDVRFTVTYPNTLGKTASSTISVPQPGGKDVNSTGQCDLDGTVREFLSISWGAIDNRTSFNLTFNSSNDKWMMVNTELYLYLDEETFPNATDAGQYLLVSGVFPGLSLVAVDTNSSLVCRAAVSSKNFTAQITNSTEAYTVTASAVGVQVEAYNAIPNTKDLQQGSRCEADITSDLVPIAVGCALAGLVLLVLISYLVGRRRRAAAYQSV